MEIAPFHGKGVLITEGWLGLGYATARAAAALGASVVVAERQETSRLASDEIASEVDSRLVACRADLASEAGVDELFDRATEHFPGLHVLVHCPSDPADLGSGLTAQLSTTEWRAGLDAYLGEPFLLARRAVDEFLAGGEGGRIVFITWGWGAGTTLPASYAAAQAGLVSFTRSLAKEYGRRRIACNVLSIEPGARLVRGESLVDGEREAALAAIADAVLFLASDAASYVNSEVLHVAGSGIEVEPSRSR